MHFTTEGVLLLVSVIGGIITQLAMVIKTNRQAKHQLVLNEQRHKLEREDREAAARLAREERILLARELREAEAAAREREERKAQEATDRLNQKTEEIKAHATFAADTQTEALKLAIEKAVALMGTEAKQAYSEANNHNEKLSKLNAAHVAQGEILRELLSALVKK